MAYPIYADSIGGIGAALANQNSQRDAMSRAAMANMMLGLGRMQQQRAQEAQRRDYLQQNQQNMLAAVADREANRRLQERQLGFEDRRLKLYENAPSPEAAKASAAADKAQSQAEQFGLQALIEGINADGTLDDTSEVFQKAHPLVKQTLLTEALRKRAELKPTLDRKLSALKIANQAARMEQVAAGIEGDRMETDRGLESRGWWPFNSQANNPADPQAIAKDLRAKALKLRTDAAPLLKESGLIENPDTKHFNAQFPNWYKPVAERQLRMIQPITGTTTNAPTGAPITGTNASPPITAPPASSGTIRVRMPDGQVLVGPATNAAAIQALGGVILSQ